MQVRVPYPNEVVTMGPPASASRRWHRLRRMFVLAGGAYLLIVVVMMVFENNLVYFPASARAYWRPKPDARIVDVSFPSRDGALLHGWYFAEPGANQALLICHGNAGNVSSRGPLMMNLSQPCRAAVFVFDYPGYGKSAGRPTETGCYAAADAAYDWLVNEKRFPPERILLVGESLGGGVAVDLARRRDHRALVLFSTFTSLPDAARVHYPWLPVQWLMRNRFDSLSKIRDCHRPLFIAHGTTDTIVPFALAERLFAAANEPKRFVAMPGHDHNDPIPSECLDELRRFEAKLPE